MPAALVRSARAGSDVSVQLFYLNGGEAAPVYISGFTVKFEQINGAINRCLEMNNLPAFNLHVGCVTADNVVPARSSIDNFFTLENTNSMMILVAEATCKTEY